MDIKVNETIWNILSENDKLTISSHLKLYGVLAPEQNIVGDIHTLPPELLKQEEPVSAHAKLIDWICKSICQSSGNADRCIHHNNGTHECLAAIRNFREMNGLQDSPANNIEIRFKKEPVKH